MTRLWPLLVVTCGSVGAACGSGGQPASSPTSIAGPPLTTAPAPLGSDDVRLPPATIDAHGDAAVWTVSPASDVTPASSSFTALVTRLGCAGGVTGDVLEPLVEIGPTDIVVTFFVAGLDSELEQTCPENDAVPVEVALGERIGDRPILDGACRSGSEAASTSHCAAGPARWVP